MEDKGMILGLNEMETPSYLVVALAVNGNKKTKYVVKWALDKFVPEGILMFRLLFVRPKITMIPTPMGNNIPVSQVREDVVDAYKKEIEWQAFEKLLPFKNMCDRKKVQVEIIQIESDDVVNAIKNEITKNSINKLVIGASSNGIFSRGRNLSMKIAENVPKFCTVYAISKGKLSSLRPSDSETIRDDSNSSDSNSIITSSSLSFTSQTEWTEQGSTSSSQFLTPLPMQRFEALSNINRNLLHKRTNSDENVRYNFPGQDSCDGDKPVISYAENSEFLLSKSTVPSSRSFSTENHSWTSDQASVSDAPEFRSEIQDENIDFEVEKLRVELRHIRGMYAVAQSETFNASRKLNDLQKRQISESIKLKESKLNEEKAKELAYEEKKKHEATKREAFCVKECVEREASARKDAEEKALKEARETQKLQSAITGTFQQYRRFTWDEITAATSSFSDDRKIGVGGNGTVYKSNFHHTVAAVKVLHSQEAHRTKQFQQELEVLSKIRHPHLLILIGACVDRGCIVYEYMENGSLDEILSGKNDTVPIPWSGRFRIAWEVASALVFLHNAKPKSIVHRDLKPANILLDRNLVSKIGDVGLSTMLRSDSFSTSTFSGDTNGPAGTVCYIDPEYQRTGTVSPKSDVYAFGIVVLQLLTGKPAMGLTGVVESAIENDELVEVLDPKAGEWPVEEAKELAVLGLRCAELRRRDRPDLKDEVVPVLERLKDVAGKARRTAVTTRTMVPTHFICPILKDVMNDPCVAADGYTYDRKAIEKWLEMSDGSPMTNLPLANTSLVPDYALLSAIIEWRSRNQRFY